MTPKDNLIAVIEELKLHSEKVINNQLEAFVDEIANSPAIYAAGAGRSGLLIRAFAMRLMHLGKKVYVLGDTTTPHTMPGDLLLIGSGSGETKSLVSAAEKAKTAKMRIALTTIDSFSTIAKLADTVIVLPGASQKVQNNEEKITSIQPMGSSFEQLSLLVYDAVIMSLMDKMSQSNDSMFKRHANIE